MNTSVKYYYVDFLKRLSCCIEHFNWNENRSAKIDKVLTYLDYQQEILPEEFQMYDEQIDRAIECFKKEQIEPFELNAEIKRLIKEIN